MIAIVFFSCFLNYLPHFEYPYLFHVDEWFHIAQAKLIVQDSSIDWYTGNPFMYGMERAWHLTLAGIYSIFHLDIAHWSILPSIFHGIAIISVYFFVARLYDTSHALIASFLIGLMASNVTMGGPVFLIPVNIGFIVIPLGLLFGFNLLSVKNYLNYAALFIIVCYTLYAHPPTAIVLLTILTIYSILLFLSNENDSKKRGALLLGTLFLSVVISIPNYLQQIQDLGWGSIDHNFWIYLKSIPFIFGIIPTVFFIIGFYFKSKVYDKKSWALLITCLILLVNIFLFSVLNINYILPYQRTFLPLFLLMSIIASVGYLKLFDYKKYFNKYVVLIFVIMLLLTGFFAVKNNVETEYYRLIDEQDYESFVWIKENTASDIVVLSDPWNARALAPVAERTVYAVMPFGPVEEQMNLVFKATAFLNTNCTNTSFLINNHIDIVYTTQPCQNANLTEVYLNTYLFKQE